MTKQAREALNGTPYTVEARGRSHWLFDSRDGGLVGAFLYLKGAVHVARLLVDLERRAAAAAQPQTGG